MTKSENLVPYLIVDGGVAAIEFYVRALGALEVYRLMEGERVAHAELSLGGATFSLADEYPDIGCVAPTRNVGSSVSIVVYVPDVDAAVARAVSAGAQVLRPITDEFYGERVCWIKDPFGHRWSINTRTEELSAQEIQARYNELVKGVK